DEALFNHVDYERREMIIVNEFTKRVITLVQSIPEKQEMTYGQIARLDGKERGARGVSWILHSSSRKYLLPWHRVVIQQEKVYHKGSEQMELLDMERMKFGNQGNIDLTKYQQHPKKNDASGRF